MYTITVALKDVDTAPTFQEAFKLFHEEVKKFVAQGGCSQMVLLEGCNIHTDAGCLAFDAACNLAADCGILQDDGALTDPLPEVSDVLVNSRMVRESTGYLLNLTKNLLA